MSDRLPLLRILLISHTVDAILPPMESNRQRDSVSMGKDTKKGFPERKLDGNPQRLKRRRATLPHPLECSTIAAPGLSYRVRNGTGRLTRAMTTANLTATARKPKESKPACYRWRFGNRLADARQTPIVVSFSDHPNAYCRPGRSSTGKTRNQPSTRGSECYVAVAR